MAQPKPPDAQDAAARSALPPHIEETLAAIRNLQAEHSQDATRVQRMVARATAELARPRFVGLLTIVVLGWIGFNAALPLNGMQPPDPAPFGLLETALTLTAVYMTVLILSTQRRDDELAARREQLTLELALLAEQKTAKVIELLEELRRDSPTLRDRVDHVAAAMAEPSDPGSILVAIKSPPESDGS